VIASQPGPTIICCDLRALELASGYHEIEELTDDGDYSSVPALRWIPRVPILRWHWELPVSGDRIFKPGGDRGPTRWRVSAVCSEAILRGMRWYRQVRLRVAPRCAVSSLTILVVEHLRTAAVALRQRDDSGPAEAMRARGFCLRCCRPNSDCLGRNKWT
jgi:hypothetical protein